MKDFADFTKEINSEPVEDEPDLPSYSDVGYILCIVRGEHEPYPDGRKSIYRWEVDVVEHVGCAFWIQEGEGFQNWLDEIDFPGPGVYVVGNIVGTYYRGDGYTTDDEIYWAHDDPRLARWSDLPSLHWLEQVVLEGGVDPIVTIEMAEGYL